MTRKAPHGASSAGTVVKIDKKPKVAKRCSRHQVTGCQHSACVKQRFRLQRELARAAG